jgi:heme-binding NEAT domain protein
MTEVKKTTRRRKAQPKPEQPETPTKTDSKSKRVELPNGLVVVHH